MSSYSIVFGIVALFVCGALLLGYGINDYVYGINHPYSAADLNATAVRAQTNCETMGTVCAPKATNATCATFLPLILKFIDSGGDSLGAANAYCDTLWTSCAFCTSQLALDFGAYDHLMTHFDADNDAQTRKDRGAAFIGVGVLNLLGSFFITLMLRAESRRYVVQQPRQQAQIEGEMELQQPI